MTDQIALLSPDEQTTASPAGVLVITVHGSPAPQGSKQAFRNQYTGRIQQVESSMKVKPWRQDVIAAALEACEGLPEFLNPLTTRRGRGIEAPDDWSAGAFEYADGSIVPVARQVAMLPLDQPVHLRMVFSFPRPKSHYRTGRNSHLLRPGAPSRPSGKPDLDKLARSTCDALSTAAIVRDDARVVEFDRLAKVWCGEDREALDTPGARIVVIPR